MPAKIWFFGRDREGWFWQQFHQHRAKNTQQWSYFLKQNELRNFLSCFSHWWGMGIKAIYFNTIYLVLKYLAFCQHWHSVDIEKMLLMLSLDIMTG